MGRPNAIKGALDSGAAVLGRTVVAKLILQEAGTTMIAPAVKNWPRPPSGVKA